jgi:hypothetical protein
MAASADRPTDLVVRRLDERGCNPRQSRPGQWNARCPVAEAHAHGDKNPSLSVGEGPDGKALLRCQTGCPMPEVARALDLRVADLFPDRPPRVTHIGGGGRVKATYSYYDAEGTLVFEVVRLDPKGFRQRRYGPNGSIVWNIQGIDDRPLYQLPQVLKAKAEGRAIWVTEGEKDAENLAWVVSPDATTTNPTGAGKWRPEHTEALRGAAVVHIVADTDRAGIDHARKVAAALADVVGDLTVWLPHDGFADISQHLGAGRGLDELRRVWVKGEPLERIDVPAVVDIGADEQQRADLLGMLIDWSTFWARDHSAEEWVAWPLIPAGRQTALYAPPKTGKSLLALAVAAAVATGRSVLGAPAMPPRSVLYLDYEMTDADLYERLESLGYGDDVDMGLFHYALLPSLPNLNTEAGRDALASLAELVDAEVVIIDTLGRAVVGEENDADTYRDFARLTGYALKAAGRAVLRTDHAGKEKDRGQRGSSAKNDDVDLVYRLDPTDAGYLLTRTHNRIAWAPDRVVLTRHTDDEEGVVMFTADTSKKERTYLPGTRELARTLDELGVAVDASRRRAGEMLAEANISVRTKRLSDALAWRRQERSLWPLELVDQPVDKGREPLGNHAESGESTTSGTTREPPPLTCGNSSGNHPGTTGTTISGEVGTTTIPVRDGGSLHPPAEPTGWLFSDPDDDKGDGAA